MPDQIPNETPEPRERCRNALRKAGLKNTQPRLAVLALLAQAPVPLSHRDICEQLSESFLNKATIFRVLVDLCEAGIVRRFDAGDHAWRFEMIDSECEAHAHLVCYVCGAVICLEGVSAVKAAERIIPKGLQHEVTDVVIKGHCATCRAENAPS